MYEFETSFNVNTGDLSVAYTGSGVHLNRNVTLSFGILDQQANLIQNDQQLINNPLVDIIVFDILDSGGNVVYPNYLSGGTTRSITISEADNQSIFGEYIKDFGVRLRVSNTMDNSVFTGYFFVYGNVPSINGFSVSDGNISYVDGTSKVFDKILVDVKIANDLRYLSFDRYDIYASTGNSIQLYSDPNLLPRNHESFIYSSYSKNIDDIYQIDIKPVGLNYNTPYYFKIVPYSSLGSGQAISFGPHMFVADATGTELSIVRSNNFEIFYGDESMNLGFTTGAVIEEVDFVLDTIETALHKTVLYTIELNHEDDRFTSSQLKVVLDNTGAWLVEDSINNIGQLTFAIAPSGVDNLYYNLTVSGPTGTYKMYKTSI